VTGTPEIKSIRVSKVEKKVSTMAKRASEVEGLRVNGGLRGRSKGRTSMIWERGRESPRQEKRWVDSRILDKTKKKGVRRKRSRRTPGSWRRIRQHESKYGTGRGRNM